MISKKEFFIRFNKNSPQNPRRNSGPIDARLFLRGLSLTVAYFFAKKGVSANTTTLLFLLTSLVANALFVMPSVYSIILFVILHEVAQLLDCVDGQLARYYGIASKYGKDFDNLVHTIVTSSFMLSFGSRLFLQTGNSLYLFLAGLGVMSKSFEHQLVISGVSFLKKERIRNWFIESKIKRYLVYGLQTLVSEVRILGIVLLIVELIQKFFLIRVNLISLAFLILVGISFFEDLVYGLYMSYEKLAHRYIKVWKGW